MAEQLKAFPYPPYDIQQQFMINVVDTLEKRQIGLFESPTGTGKTLSVICSTLYWLEVERERQQKAAAEALAQDSEGLPDWLLGPQTVVSAPTVTSHKPKPKQQPNLSLKAAAPVLDDEGNDLSEFLPAAAAQLNDTASPGTKRAAPDAGGYNSSSSSSEDETPAADAESDVAAGAVERRQPQVIFCSRTHSQLSQFVGELHRTRFGSSVLLVAVASRKALCVNDEVRQLSELSQVNERCLDLQRNKSASSSSKRKSSLAGAPGSAPLNSSVVGFSGAPRSRQQQRRQRSSRKASGCPFLFVEGGATAWDDFKDLVLGAPMDVEELASLGRKMKICPYYGSRRAVPGADVVLAPYSAVLMPDARESLGIELQDSVLVFDEAHNLLDAINSAHSSTVTAWQLLSVQRSLTAYYDRFKAVLNPVNAQNIQRLLHIASALHRCLQQQQQITQDGQQQPAPASMPATNGSGSGGRLTTVNDLLFDLGLDSINMFELAHWVKDNKMAFKVSGYTAAAVAKAGGSIQLQQGGKSSTNPADSTKDQQPTSDQQHTLGHLSAKDGVSAIHSFIAFLLSLTHADADGRVIIQQPTPSTATNPTAAAAAALSAAQHTGSSRPDHASRGGQLRYVLLNAARHFGKLLASARSVLLVSGTLAPIEGLQAQLFPDIEPERVRHFECGHVVPPEQLLTVSIGRGPSGKPLNLKHEARVDAGMMSELGQLLVNLSGVVPEGLVVFVPSFGYLEQLTQHWRAAGLFDRLAQRKQVFSEPRASTEVEAVLAAYAATIGGSTDSQAEAAADAANGVTAAAAQPSAHSKSRCALMLCVVGGKLSEGINFGDGLGRCVVVVGLPYPNRTDVELQARMHYLDGLAAQAAAGAPAAPAASAAPADSTTAQHADTEQMSQQQQQQQQGQLAAAPMRRSVFHVFNQGGPRPVQAAAAGGSPAADAQQPPAHATAVAAAAAVDSAAAATPASGQLLADQPPAPAGAGPGAGVRSQQPGKHTSVNSSRSSRTLITGRDYYEDLCFKAVNQCVGRVVRHKGDYAAVVLLDSRWVAGPAEWAAINSSSSSSRRKVPVQKLPGWLQRSYVPTTGEFGPALKQLAAFYKRQAQPTGAQPQ